MIVGIGIDLVDVERIRNAMVRTEGRFADRISDPESEVLASKAPLDVAARFAVKEACLKALGTGIARQISMSNVSVSERPGGITIMLSAGAADRARRLGVKSIHPTLSVSATTVLAVVILEGGSSKCTEALVRNP